jgi:UV DNA damage endonuclease
MRMVAAFDFDAMLEAKAKDLALVRLRLDLLRYAPDVAERFGIQLGQIDKLANEEGSAMETS